MQNSSIPERYPRLPHLSEITTRHQYAHPLTERLRQSGGDGSQFVAHLDALLRNPIEGNELLPIVQDFAILYAAPAEFEPLRARLLEALVYDARAATKARRRCARLRSLWGVTPINNMALCSRADQMLGNEAESLVFTTYYVTSDFSIVLKQHEEWIVANHPELHPVFRWLVFFWAMLTYDVFHYYNDAGILADIGGYNGTNRFGVSLTEMQLLKAAGKRLFTYAYGADYRSRAKTLASNPYNFCTFCTAIGKYCLCDDANARLTFAVIGQYANALIATGLAMEQIPGAVDLQYLVVDTEKVRSVPAEPHVGPLRIGHVPNHPFFKGTHLLQAAVEQLQAEGEPLELKMLSGVSQDRVFEHMASCDVVADQFISGWYGLTSLEAMALGRPVLCYLRDDLAPVCRDELPIINAHPEKLNEVLRGLVRRRSEMPAIGQRSREYVERYHSVEAFSTRLKGLYLERAFFEEPLLERLRSGRISRTPAKLLVAWFDAVESADGAIGTSFRFGMRVLDATYARLAAAGRICLRYLKTIHGRLGSVL
jgi:glycosyltransferase involved in cell wall biosynthesis